MSKEEFFGVTDKDIYNFVETCSSKEDGFLHITTQALADTFVLMCKKFQGASILEFYYTTENQNGRIMYKRKNDLYLHLGLHVFLPDLRFGETYLYDVTLLFKDIFEVSYNPIDINENTEIEIDSFTVTQNECLFSCNAKDNKKRKFSVKAKELLVENYITPEDEEEDDEILEDESVNSKKEKTVKPFVSYITFSIPYSIHLYVKYTTRILLLSSQVEENMQTIWLIWLKIFYQACLKRSFQTIRIDSYGNIIHYYKQYYSIMVYLMP